MQDEFNIYQQISKANPAHRGFPFVRTALDIFVIPRAGGDHSCLVQQPMWGSVMDLLHGDATKARLPEKVLKIALKDILAALDYLHSECKLVHTGMLKPPPYHAKHKLRLFASRH